MNLAAAFTPVASDIPPLYQHQRDSITFYHQHAQVLNHSEPGSAKTRAWLEFFRDYRSSGGGAALVIAPRTIMESAWRKDAATYTPELRVSVASAENRRDGLRPGPDIYIVNPDGLRALARDPSLLPPGLTALNIDEATCFKNPAAARTRDAIRLLQPLEHRVLMSGSPAPQGVTDLWSQAFLADHGERLGTSYWKFRDRFMYPVPVGPGLRQTRWVERPDAPQRIADLLGDITLRFRLDDCIDLPKQVEYFVEAPLSPAHRRAYEQLLAEGRLLLRDGGLITATAAASLRLALLQTLTGGAYGVGGTAHQIATERDDLVLDLVEARAACIVSFQFRHQRDRLLATAKKRRLPHGLIDGTVPLRRRTEVVEQFQRGDLRVLFMHPATGSHGLTLTRGTTLIWASPTDNAEHFQQMAYRIRRPGQVHKTEVIKICATNTIETRVYHQLRQKLTAQAALLQLLE
jgi:hypothetical protein